MVWRSGNVHTSGDDVESDELSSTDEENSTGGNSSHKSDTDEGYVVLGSCDSFDAIPYPLSEDMEVRCFSASFGLVSISGMLDLADYVSMIARRLSATFNRCMLARV